MAHYDKPPPETIKDIEALRDADRFRFANILSAWVETDRGGEIKKCGYSGGGMMGATTVKVGPVSRTFEAVGLPDIRRDPERRRDYVRFTQTTGGRTASRRRAACAANRSCNGRRRWSGRRCR